MPTQPIIIIIIKSERHHNVIVWRLQGCSMSNAANAWLDR